jgi:hypothetical protein
VRAGTSSMQKEYESQAFPAVHFCSPMDWAGIMAPRPPRFDNNYRAMLL